MITVTLNEQLAVLPEASVVTEFTVVVPTGKNDPDAGVETTFAEQLSFVLTLKFILVPQANGSVFTIISAGQLICGASLSVTFTLNEQLEVLPDASVAIEETRVVPTGNIEPEGGIDTKVTAQLSVAPTIKLTLVPHKPKSVVTAVSAGQVITGNSRSLRITLKEQIVSLCEESFAV